LARKYLIVAGLTVIAIIVVLGYSLCGHNVSDNEAIGIAKSLSDRLNIKHNHQLSVKSKSIMETLFIGTDAIPVVFTDNNKLLAFVSDKNKQVSQLSNPEAMDRVLSELGPEYRKTWPSFWKQEKPGLFIDENSAKQILLEHASKIGLPRDVEHPEFRLDKDYGLWIATWKRKYNRYLFDKDYVSISIIAVNGEFNSYSKSYNGEPCSTEVKIEKKEAIGTAFKKFINYFPKGKWEKNKEKFEIVSSELRIVKPDEYWRRLIPFNSSKSRLAWVVVFDVKKGQEAETIGVLNKDKSVIKVDAASNKILSSEINIVP